MNSFVRQLNMYNFHKKRTMTTDHVYFHDLFKRGHIELLKHIKRKHSDGPSGLTSLYEITHGYSLNAEELTHENLLLKKLNQKAFSQISSLEARINDLVEENDILGHKIMEKEKNEQIIESAFTKLISSETNSPGHSSFSDTISRKDKSLIREIKATLCSKNDIKLENSPKPLPNNQNYQIDSFANIDSFLELEQNDSSSNMEFYTPSLSKSSLNDLSTSILNPNQDEDLKRKYQVAINSSDEENSPQLKCRHIDTFTDEKDNAPNFLEIDFPFFLGFQDEKI